MGTFNAILALTSLTAAASAVPAIDWYSIDGGGGTSSSGTISLSGAIGQPDAGATMTGGTLSVMGGFFAATCEADALPGCNVADVAVPYGILDLSDINIFAGSFLANTPLGDIDGNGIFDLTDINLFIGAFTSGCP